MFRRRGAGATDGTAQDDPGAQSPDGPAEVKQARPAAQAGKGRPTPKRSEAERGRYQPITGSRTGSRPGSRTGSRAPAAPRTPEEKQKARSENSRRMAAARRGEEWALYPRDRGPAKALARDYVDSRRSIGEYSLFIVVLLFAALFTKSKTAQEFYSPLILAVIAFLVIDAQLVRRRLAKLVAERLPGQSTRGLTLYAMQRGMMFRRWRTPIPRVNRGDKI